MILLTRLGTPFTITVIIVALTILAYGANLMSRSRPVRAIASTFFLLALAVMSWIIADRYIEAGRPPFKTLFESLILFGWSVALIYVVVERFYRLALLGFLNAIFIPLLAVIPMESGKAVYIVQDDHAVRKDVELGVIKGDRIQILKGLSAGNQLIVEGHRFVSPGLKVAVIPKKL